MVKFANEALESAVNPVFAVLCKMLLVLLKSDCEKVRWELLLEALNALLLGLWRCCLWRWPKAWPQSLGKRSKKIARSAVLLWLFIGCS
jgi:hypothetical protein